MCACRVDCGRAGAQHLVELFARCVVVLALGAKAAHWLPARAIIVCHGRGSAGARTRHTLFDDHRCGASLLHERHLLDEGLAAPRARVHVCNSHAVSVSAREHAGGRVRAAHRGGIRTCSSCRSCRLRCCCLNIDIGRRSAGGVGGCAAGAASSPSLSLPVSDSSSLSPLSLSLVMPSRWSHLL